MSGSLLTPAPPVLLAGTPRSGSTWVGEVLSRTDGVGFLHEPDNETQQPFAVRAKAALGRWPVLAPGDSVPADYERLWEHAFAGLAPRRTPAWAAAKGLLRRTGRSELLAAFSPGGRLSPRLRAVSALAAPPGRRLAGSRVVVKSVHSALALEWVAARWRPAVLVIVRNPLNVVASWGELNWGGLRIDRHPVVVERFVEPLGIVPLPDDCSRLALITWQIALSTLALQQAAVRHPSWHLVSHEQLCIDPEAELQRLAAAVGLEWNDRARRFLAQSNRPGTGITTFRVASDQPDRWRRRLDADQVNEIRRVLAGFPLPFCDGAATA